MVNVNQASARVRDVMLCALVGFMPGSAWAQEQNTVSVREARTAVAYEGSSPLQALRRHIRAGDEAAARQLAAELIKTIRNHPDFAGCCSDDSVVRVVFAATDAAGQRMLARVVFGPHPELGYLTGVSGDARPVEDLFLSEDPGSGLITTMKLAAEEDPVLSQAADLAKTALSGLVLGSSTALAGGSAIAGGGLTETVDVSGGGRPSFMPTYRALTEGLEWVIEPNQDPTKPAGVTLAMIAKTIDEKNARRTVQVEWRRTNLDYARGSLTIVDQMTVGDQIGALLFSARDIAAEVLLAPNIGECGKQVAARMPTALTDGAAADACMPGQLVPPAGCLTELRKAFAKALDPRPDPSAPTCDDDRVRVARMFEDIVSALPGPLSAQATFKNVPRSRFSVGLGTAVITRAWVDEDNPKVQVQNGNVAISTISRTTAFAAVNWHPWAFTPRAVGMDGWRESLRLFGAAGIAPSFGLGGGVGVGVTRLIALNFGAMWLLADTVEASRVGTPVTDPVPFKAGWIPAVFAGGSFRLK